MWTGELRYEVRPCRWADGRLALWQPHRPGAGRPLFKKPHNVRQRQSVARFLCTVCGEHTVPSDRWWFKLGQFNEGWFMTTEAPVHRTCAELALTLCPHLKDRGADLERFPSDYSVLQAIVGGFATERDFGVNLAGRTVVGALKFAWPASRVQRAPRPLGA
jgi:hypothetical protein